MLSHPITGLVAATHTPFHPDGSLNLAVVEKQAAHLLATGVKRAFIGGTTGESHSLSLLERRALTERWMEVTKGSALKVIVHVGTNCLSDARDLAAQARECGAEAISAVAPSYFKPRDVSSLVAVCAEIAGAAPELPFFYYDIPSFTGLSHSIPEFLERAGDRIPNLAGIKFTNPDGMMFQQCLHHRGGAWSILWGTDECLLAGLALGAKGAVGSTYNFAAPVYHRIMTSWAADEFETARSEQKHSVDLVARLASIGYMGAAKAVMGMLGVPVGPARLPHANPDTSQVTALKNDLEEMGFFDWVKPGI
jgi:N-acetylneuraminate lyase